MTKNNDYEMIAPRHGGPVKMWTHRVPVDEQSKQRPLNTASMPFIYK
jgi:tRNA-splicing ligase RtcB (3'-phosphate/5'-hydroxy nucleic acid ligase)